MSKILSATCESSVVTSDGVTVSTVTILSKGTGPSSGFLVLDKETAFYIASNATDIEDALTSLTAALTKVADSLTAIAAVTGPSWVPPPSLVTNVADIQTKIATLNTLKGNLK